MKTNLTALLKRLRLLKEKSTKVVAWYPGYSDIKGPFNRWLTVTDVPEQYKDSVGTKEDDAAFFAATANILPTLLKIIEKQNEALEKTVNDPCAIPTVEYARQAMTEIEKLVDGV